MNHDIYMYISKYRSCTFHIHLFHQLIDCPRTLNYCGKIFRIQHDVVRCFGFEDVIFLNTSTQYATCTIKTYLSSDSINDDDEEDVHESGLGRESKNCEFVLVGLENKQAKISTRII